MTNYEKWKAEQPAIERLLEEIQKTCKSICRQSNSIRSFTRYSKLGNRRNSRTSRVE